MKLELYKLKAREEGAPRILPVSMARAFEHRNTRARWAIIDLGLDEEGHKTYILSPEMSADELFLQFTPALETDTLGALILGALSKKAK